jgi:membrane fusion protein (multidrug efflux system)
MNRDSSSDGRAVGGDTEAAEPASPVEAQPAAEPLLFRPEAVTFDRTWRALRRDSFAAHAAIVSVGVVLLSAWWVWFALARIAVFETTDRASLEVEAQGYPIAARTDGRVLRTTLELGHTVQAGELVVELDSGPEQMALSESRARMASLRAQIAGLSHELASERTGLEAQERLRGAQHEEADAKIREAQARAQFAESQVETRRALRLRNFISEEAVSQAQSESNARAAMERAAESDAARVAHQAQVDQVDRQTRLARLERTRTELEGDLAAQEATARRREREIDLHRILAPVSGKVGRVERLPPGSVVETAQVLAVIVPEGRPRVIGFFPVASVGRIRVGQLARVRLDGFPWTQYGMLSATVSAVGNEPKDGRVRVELALTGEAPAGIPLEHGLTGSAEVEVEQATPLALILRIVGARLAASSSTASSPNAADAATRP